MERASERASEREREREELTAASSVYRTTISDCLGNFNWVHGKIPLPSVATTDFFKHVYTKKILVLGHIHYFSPFCLAKAVKYNPFI
jgi:hypothetical protein